MSTRERVEWVAQTIHQAHHDVHQADTWETCESSVCRELKSVVTGLKQAVPIPDEVFGATGPVFHGGSYEDPPMIYLVFIINDAGVPTPYIPSFNKQEAVDRAKSVHGIVACIPFLHDFRKPAS